MIHTLERFQKKTIGVIGDLILDRYTFGHTKRVSPEAPVPVLSVAKEEKKAGGAGNVALNLLALGMNVKLMSRVGSDPAGEELRDLLSQATIDCSFILPDTAYTTSVKNRFIAASQQLLRVDSETVEPLSQEQEARFLASLPSWLEGVDTIALSDYAKGFLTDRLIAQVIAQANALGKQVIVDPKSTDFRKYKGAHLIKPNYQEALMAVPQSERTLEKAARWIQGELHIPHVMITRSEEGISLYSPQEGLRHFPVLAKKEVRDGTGAGDTVLACLTAALASNISIEEAIPLANTFASIGVERVGCAVISFNDLAFRLLHQNPTGKILTWKAFETAHGAFSQKELCLFFLPPLHALHLDSLKTLTAKASQLPDTALAIAFIQESSPDDCIIELLSSVDSLDWVVFDAPHDVVQARFCGQRECWV